MSQRSRRFPFLLTDVRRQLRLLRWLVPAILMVVVAAYEIGFMDWVHHSLGPAYHIVADVLVFGTVGPVLAFFLIDLFGRWLEERDTSDLQARILAQAREDATKSRELCDETLQVLFSTGALLTLLKSHETDLSPETVAQIETMETALNQSVSELRSRLLDSK